MRLSIYSLNDKQHFTGKEVKFQFSFPRKRYRGGKNLTVWVQVEITISKNENFSRASCCAEPVLDQGMLEFNVVSYEIVKGD